MSKFFEGYRGTDNKDPKALFTLNNPKEGDHVYRFMVVVNGLYYPVTIGRLIPQIAAPNIYEAVKTVYRVFEEKYFYVVYAPEATKDIDNKALQNRALYGCAIHYTCNIQLDDGRKGFLDIVQIQQISKTVEIIIHSHSFFFLMVIKPQSREV